MFEKFLSKKEKDRNPERLANFGTKFLEAENRLDIAPKRLGGYLLSTLFATWLAMGAMGGKAEAQVLLRHPIGRGPTTNEILNNAAFAAQGTMDKYDGARRSNMENEYVAKLGELEQEERRLDQEYQNKTSRLFGEVKDPKELRKLEAEYQTAKDGIRTRKIELRRQHDKKARNSNIKRQVVDTIFQGVKGW